MDLNLVRLFIAIAEARNLTDAAARSGVTRSNVSRRLGLLEREFGAQLLRRTTRHVELTEAGRILYAHCLQAVNELQSARSRIDEIHRTVSGDIRVRIPTGLGHFYLKPLILGFCRDYPGLRLKLVINDQIHDLVASKVDLAIHITSTPFEDHVATRVCGIQWGLFCTPAYLQRLGRAIRTPGDLKAASLITPLATGPRIELLQSGTGESIWVQHQPAIQSGDYQFLFDAACADLGVVLLPHYAVADAVAAGTLVRVLKRMAVKGVGDALYIVRAPNRQPTSAAVAFIEFLKAAIVEYARNWDFK
ncbi:LysR family transcriptional regulator [Comamonas humi]